VQPPFIEQADGLVGEAGGKAGDSQRAMARRLARREHGALGRHEAVEIVEHGVAVDQHRPVVEHQGGHARERIVGADLVRIGERRPGTMLEREIVERQRDADAADERRVVLADEDHGRLRSRRR